MGKFKQINRMIRKVKLGKWAQDKYGNLDKFPFHQ